MRNKLILLIMVLALVLSACAATQPATEPTVEPTAMEAPADDVETPVVDEAEAAAPTQEPEATAEEMNTSIVLVDALDRELVLADAPQRILVTGKGMLIPMDVVFSFPEASERVVDYAVADQGYGNFAEFVDPKYEERTLFNNMIGTEEILTYEPDLVILKSYMADTIGAPLEELGVPVMYVDFETPEQYQRDLTNLGLIFQNEARATELLSYYDETIASVQDVVGAIPEEERPTTLFLYYSSKDGEVAFNVPPLSYIQSYMVMQAGGNPVWTDAELQNSWTTVSMEQIAAWNPEVVFVTTYFNDIDSVMELLKADPQWQEMDAVKNGAFYGVPAVFYPWDQPLTRWGLTVQWMADKLYPEQMQLDFDAEARAYYAFFYGLDDAAYDAVILPRYHGDIE